MQVRKSPPLSSKFSDRNLFYLLRIFFHFSLSLSDKQRENSPPIFFPFKQLFRWEFITPSTDSLSKQEICYKFYPQLPLQRFSLKPNRILHGFSPSVADTEFSIDILSIQTDSSELSLCSSLSDLAESNNRFWKIQNRLQTGETLN